MAASEKGRLGRQLLATRNNLRDESDTLRRMKLARREIGLLRELGNLDAAWEAAESLRRENPDWPAGLSTMADLACRMGHWEEAESLFESAADANLKMGDEDSASKLRTGPLYRLAEARMDYSRCFELCSDRNAISKALMNRVMRLSAGRTTSFMPDKEEELPWRIAMLENVWRGSSPRILLKIVLDWGNSEPEWRWRFIVEGIHLWESHDLNTRQWRKPLKETECPVLDPRFNKEWTGLSHSEYGGR